MTAVVASEAFGPSRSRAGAATIAPALAFAAIGSIGAGAVHAAAIGVHSEHRQAVITFTILAIVQLGWGVFALQRSGRLFVFAGAAINAAAVVGWVMAKTSGISFIDGLEDAESAQFADGAAAALAAIAVVAVLAALLWRNPQAWFGSLAFSGTALAVAVFTAFAMVSAGSHTHAHGAVGHTHATGGGAGGGAPHSHASAVVPPKQYDPKKPIDLGGVPGVSLEQQARAENLIAITLMRLPKFSDYHVAEKNGFVSIGDAVTGDEHFINTSYFDDGRILDPDHPESLVYEPDGNGGKKLAAAMFMMPPNSKFSDVPDVGGKLTQWHIHNNLCFTSDAKVAGLANPDGSCTPPLVKGSRAPMIHVWIQKNACGPFAALEGVGGGQIAAGESRLCDQAHGA